MDGSVVIPRGFLPVAQQPFQETHSIGAATMKSLRLTLAWMVAFGSVATLALPLPQSLTEEQFRGFGDSSPRSEESAPEVRIHSGYSKVMRFGRGFAHGPLRGFGPVTVKDPFKFQTNNEIQRVTYDDDKAPVFDLEKMMEEEAIKKAIEEANRVELMEDTTESATDAPETTVSEMVDEDALEVTEPSTSTESVQEELTLAAEEAVQDLEEVAGGITETFSGSFNSFENNLNNILNDVDDDDQVALDEINELEGRIQAAQTTTEEPEYYTRRNPLAEIELDDVFDPFAFTAEEDEILDDEPQEEASSSEAAPPGDTTRNPLAEVRLDDVFIIPEEELAEFHRDDSVIIPEEEQSEVRLDDVAIRPEDTPAEVRLDDVFIIPEEELTEVRQDEETISPEDESLAEIRLDDVFVIPEEELAELARANEAEVAAGEYEESAASSEPSATETNEIEAFTEPISPEDIPRRPAVVFEDDYDYVEPRAEGTSNEDQPPQEIDLGSVQEPGPGIDRRPFSTADFFADHFTIHGVTSGGDPGPGIDRRPFSTADFFADHFTIHGVTSGGDICGSDIELLEAGGLLPICRHHILAVKGGLLHEKTLQILAALKEDLQRSTFDFFTIVHIENLEEQSGFEHTAATDMAYFLAMVSFSDFMTLSLAKSSSAKSFLVGVAWEAGRAGEVGPP
eukprot:snap_masked-scaffold9_size846264-processed-gene-3.0 protein:Tk08391 transcript:snap_masked-scaffold9_size846264-processed-gene-3.0-mRNA-1 annotation:"conserved hypothetical protein"